MRYLPNEARREAEAAIAAAQEEAARQRATAEDCSRRCDAAERRAQDTEAEAARKVREAEWTFSQESTGYQDRIVALEQLLEDERSSHAAELEQREEILRAAEEAAELRFRQAQDRCTAAVAAADARAAEAQQAADDAKRHAAAEVATARTREEARVQEVRREAAAAVQEAERKRRQEVEQLQADVAAERRSMKAALHASRQEQGRTLDEAERRITEREQSLGEWRALKELELSKKEASLEAWIAAEHEHRAAADDHHKDLMTLERDMHRRTMERTLDRVTRHLAPGADEHAGGRDTPTREVVAAASLPEGSPAAREEPAADGHGERSATGFDALVQAVLRQSTEAIAEYPGDLDERGRYSREDEWPVALPPGYTALGVAAAFGKKVSAEALLRAGANPRGLDESGAYPLAIAHAACQPEIAELIRTWPTLPPVIKQTWPKPGALMDPL